MPLAALSPQADAHALSVGLVIHDNIEGVDDGWSFKSNQTPVRVRGLHDLAGDHLWISSGTSNAFFMSSSAARAHQNVRHAQFLKLSLTQIANDLGVRIDGDNAYEGGQILVAYVEMALKMTAHFYGKSGQLFGFGEETLCKNMLKHFPRQPPIPDEVGTMFEGAYQDYSATHPEWLENAVTLTMRLPRLPYATKMLQCPVPDGAWSYEESVTHEQIVEDNAPPRIIKAALDVSRVLTPDANLAAFGVAMSTGRKPLRRYMTDVEYKWLADIPGMKIHVGDAVRSSKYWPIADNLQLPSAFIEDPFFHGSVGAGLVAFNHWNTLASKRYSMQGKKLLPDSSAVWLKAYDRWFSYRFARVFHDQKFEVQGYGAGSISVRVRRDRLQELAALAQSIGVEFPNWTGILEKFGLHEIK